MSVVVYESPCNNRGSRIKAHYSNSSDKIIPVLIIVNDLEFFNTPNYHVMQRPRRIKPCSSRNFLFSFYRSFSPQLLLVDVFVGLLLYIILDHFVFFVKDVP